MDATTTSVLISLVPVVVAIAFYWIAKKGKVSHKNWYFVLGMIFMSLFFIFATDPSLVLKLYVDTGDYAPALEFAVISGVFLFVAIFYFKKHLEGKEK